MRGWLALLAARYVLQAWQSVWPENSLATHLIGVAESVLRQDIHEEGAREQAEDAWNKLEELMITHTGLEHGSAISAGLASVRAVFEAIGTHPFVHAPASWLNENDTDESALDPWCTDAAKWAADAYAGQVWDQHFDPVKQKEFWQWWLFEAIPAAWHAVDKHST